MKYATCIITDSVSSTGINAITNNISGIFKYSAIPDITPPNRSDPVSPINTFAGCKLNIKNPNTPPITILPNIDISVTPCNIPTTVKQVIIIVDILDDNQSIPSVKFTAFVVANITQMAAGTYIYIGNVIYVFIIGIYVSVPSFKPSIRYNTNATDIIKSPNIL